MFIEVKSTYTWSADYEINLAKLNQTPNIQLWIFDEKNPIPLIFNKENGFPDKF